MRRIEWTTSFKRDFKRELKGKFRAVVEGDLFVIIEHLAKDEILAPRFRDHALSGNWKRHRDCHIKPDLVLIYLKPDEETIVLERLGSHSELGL